MNKATKGALAAVAAVVLLLGGLGSFALWNDDATTDGGTITAGDLTITPDGDGVWAQTTSDVNAASTIDIDDYLVVPGDIVTYTQDYTIEASGDNLLADLTVDLESITGSGGLLEQMEVTVSGTSGTTALPTNGEAVRIASIDQDVTVVVTFDFDDQTAGLVAQNGTVDLSSFTLDITQSRTP